LTHAAANETVVAGVGLEPTVLPRAADVSPYDPQPSIRTPSKYAWPYVGAGNTRHNSTFMPPHRSGSAAVRMSWDRMTRRVRWLLTNNSWVKRLTELLTQHVIGDGISVYSAAIDHVPIEDFAGDILNHQLFRFGDESDEAFDFWAQRYADVERRKTLAEMQTLAGRELFGVGNVLWLKCAKRTPERVPTPTVCWQVLEAEQLDRTQDRPAGPGQNRISNGIEYASDGEPIAYHLYDVHPYDDGFGQSAAAARSRRVPAARVIHLALTSRASQDFGAPLANLLMDSVNDLDWLIGHELTSVAILAGLTLALRESDEAAELGFEGTESQQTIDPALLGLGDLPTVREIGLSSGSVARLGKDESIEVIESKNRPNLNVVEFGEHLFNYMSMAFGCSFHRALGNPKGASFASLRAMMADDRAMSRPLTRMVGWRLGHRIRRDHDQQLAALGGYRSVEVGEYSRSIRVYQDYEVQGPPAQNLTDLESVKTSRARIESGLSTLRLECALLNLNFRAVLRQLALEKSLTAALGLALNFSTGGGGPTLERSTTAAGGEASL
jgi:capsid protein